MEGSEVFLASLLLLLQLPVANHLVEQEGLNTAILALRIVKWAIRLEEQSKLHNKRSYARPKTHT